MIEHNKQCYRRTRGRQVQQMGELVNRGGSNGSNSDSKGEDRAGSIGGSPSASMMEEIKIYPLVLPIDNPLIFDYLYMALEQMQLCNLMDDDWMGCYKGRHTGFRGWREITALVR